MSPIKRIWNCSMRRFNVSDSSFCSVVWYFQPIHHGDKLMVKQVSKLVHCQCVGFEALRLVYIKIKNNIWLNSQYYLFKLLIVTVNLFLVIEPYFLPEIFFLNALPCGVMFSMLQLPRLPFSVDLNVFPLNVQGQYGVELNSKETDYDLYECSFHFELRGTIEL